MNQEVKRIYLYNPSGRLVHPDISSPSSGSSHVSLDPAWMDACKTGPREVLGKADGQHVEGSLGAAVGRGVGGGGLRDGDAAHA